VALTIVLWAAISGLFSYYVATIARYATLYGQLAAVAIFLLWLWLLALALLIGGEANAQLDGLRNPVAMGKPPSSEAGVPQTPPVAIGNPDGRGASAAASHSVR
jgi:membrane protein